eukprot:CAMPEP_0168268218 /NCGR_PEP_ID=MMETSP0141_2-20121125/13571_1 /TAXON_ID=44445 /ORGANISM="Pseudo-nitzschia australis, Strain 10249 10 AB" /LENGTH=661 /DNA_ID=CAMNT_0008208571 /DNA_START=120 /DNA_END=2105 /DNA_ORIENTATION=+
MGESSLSLSSSDGGCSDECSYESALKALLTPGIHQANTKEGIARAALRATKTVYKILRQTAAKGQRQQHTNRQTKNPLLIHITGTKGKGSTACMCEAIMRAHGYSTGLFTSPHLIDIRERIRWNGKPIHQSIFADVYWTIRRALESETNSVDDDNDDLPPVLPGYFRMLTLMGMYTFLHKLSSQTATCVDVIVLEVGMGGRYDATNFLDTSGIAWAKGGIFSVDKLNPSGTCPNPGVVATASASTSTSLGETETQNDDTTKQREKAEDHTHGDGGDGDDRENCLSSNIVLDSNTQGVIEVMKNCARVEGKGGIVCLADASGANLKKALQLQNEGSNNCKTLSLGLAGSHQYGNATLAIALCQAVTAGCAEINQGTINRIIRAEIKTDSPTTLNALAGAAWPGRCQKLLWTEGLDAYNTDNRVGKNIVEFYLDGAHTPQSLAATVQWFRSKIGSTTSSRSSSSNREIPPILIFNCSHERNPVELLELLEKREKGACCSVRSEYTHAYSRVYFAKSDSSRFSAVEEPSAEKLLEERGIVIRDELLLPVKGESTTTRTWQETLAIVWKHLITATTTTNNNNNSNVDDKTYNTPEDVIFCNMAASQILNDIISMPQETQDDDDKPTGSDDDSTATSRVFVTGSLYLVGSFLTAMDWKEESSPPLN